MELYRRFAFKPFPEPNRLLRDLDGVVSDVLNEMVREWAEKMRAGHKNFRYRIVNCESVIDPRTKITPHGVAVATAVLHVVYEI